VRWKPIFKLFKGTKHTGSWGYSKDIELRLILPEFTIL
jgi:hypothetical protein